MASLTMDNPLSPSPQVQVEKVVQDVIDCIEEMSKDFEDLGYPITDDSQTLHRFCAKLERLLQTGFKGKTSLFGDKKDYWNYFCDCIGSTKDLRDGIKFVKANPELRTSLGRGRAFLRFALVHQRLADTLQQCVCGTKQTNDWYHPRAVWLQPALSSTIINALYDLNNIQFDLQPRGYDLDTTWPTFARKTFGSPQNWAPPSRSVSISSLSSSIPALEIPASPSLYSIPLEKDTEQIDKLQEELNESENEKFALQLKVESLSENKRMSAERVAELEKKVEELQKSCNEYEKRCDMLTKEMQIKETIWQEKEESFKSQIEQGEQALGEIKNQLSVTGAKKDALTQAELVTKLAIQKKETAAIKIELKTAQLELQCKTQTDAGKTKVIELLDKKIEQLQGQNSRMLTQIEKVSEDRMRDAEGSKTSQMLIEATMDRLKRAEAINTELQKANESLRTMLHSMEEKCQKIGNLAKEKMTLYKTENTKLQLDVQSLMKEVAKLKTSGPGEAEKAPVDADDSSKTVDDALIQALENARKDVEMWKSKYEESTTELEKLRLSKIDAANTDLENQTAGANTSTKLQEVEKQKEEMKKALDKSREEVKKILVAKMKVDEEAKMVEVKQIEARARHEDLLKDLALKETEARRLELELDEIKSMVEASESGQSGAEESGADDKPIIAKIKSILKEITQSKLQIQTGEVQNISLRKDLETSERKCEDMSKEYICAQLQIADLKTAVSKSEVDAADMVSKLDELEMRIGKDEVDFSEKEIEIQKLTTSLEEKNRELKLLEKLLDERAALQENLQQSEEMNGELSREKENLKQREEEVSTQTQSLLLKVEEFKQRYEDLMEQKIKVQAQLHESETKLKNTKQTLKKVDKENKKLLIERDALKKETGSLQDELKQLNESNNELKIQIAELEKSITHIVEEKLTTLQEEVNQEQTGRKKLESDIAGLREKHSENEKIVEQLQNKRMTSSQQHQEEIQIKQSEIDEWRDKYDHQTKQHECLLSEKEGIELRVQEEHNKLKEDLDVAKCNYEKLQYELEGEMLSIKETEKLILTHLESDVKVGGAAGLATLASSLIDELVGIQGAMSSKEDELSNALLSLETQAKSINELEISTQKYLNENTENEMLQNKMKLEYSDLKKELDGLKSDRDKEKENLTIQIKEFEKTGSEMQIKNQEWRDKFGERTKELEKLQTEQLQRQVELDSQHSEKLVTLQQTLKEKQAEISSLQKSLEKQSTKFSGVVNGLEQEISSLKFELSSQQMEHQEALQGLQGRASNISDLVSKLNAQESLIDMLEKELETLKRERLLEKNRTLNELEELRQSIRGRDEECKLLNSELKRTSMLLDDERNVSLKFKNELVEVKSEYEHQLRMSRQEVEMLQEDTNVLKQQLVKIVKDKDILWQKTDKLEYLQKLTVSGSWMEDADTKQCLSCKSEFSFLLRKHHCRLCGRIFCFTCCNKWIQSPHSSKKIRICNDCGKFHHLELDRALEETNQKASDTGAMDESTDSFNDSSSRSVDPEEREGALPTAASSAKRLEDTADEEEEPPSSFHVDDDLLEDANLPSPANQPTHSKTTLAGSPLPEVSGVPSDNPESHEERGAESKQPEDDITPSHIPTEKDSHQSSDNEDESDNFDVITPEEVVQSMHESVYEVDSQNLSSPMITVEQIANGLNHAEPDLWIKAGKIYTVPVFIDAPGIVLCWEFSTEPKGIHFSVTFRRDALTSNDLSDVLIPLCPCNSHRQAVQGELIAVQPGLYTLVFDNSTSRFTSKKLVFQLNVKKPEAAD